MHHLIAQFEGFFHSYGLWAVFVMLLLENAGLPLPGEAVLLYSSFLAHQNGSLRLTVLMGVGTIACILGDNAGYWIGRKAGLWFRRVFRLTHERLAYAEHFFHRYGAFTIFFARFVAGLRIIAGPAAGLYRMPWRQFLFFNALGAIVWVSTIASAGYLLGRHWSRLVRILGRVDLLLFLVALAVIVVLVRRLRRDAQQP